MLGISELFFEIQVTLRGLKNSWADSTFNVVADEEVRECLTRFKEQSESLISQLELDLKGCESWKDER